LFSFVFTLSSSKHGCNEGEDEETYFSLGIIHVFVHACEACYGLSSIALAWRMGQICNLEHGNESMGQHVESRADIRISRPLVVGFVER
jgi:hypothetical protein